MQRGVGSGTYGLEPGVISASERTQSFGACTNSLPNPIPRESYWYLRETTADPQWWDTVLLIPRDLRLLSAPAVLAVDIGTTHSWQADAMGVAQASSAMYFGYRTWVANVGNGLISFVSSCLGEPQFGSFSYGAVSTATAGGSKQAFACVPSQLQLQLPYGVPTRVQHRLSPRPAPMQRHSGTLRSPNPICAESSSSTALTVTQRWITAIYGVPVVLLLRCALHRWGSAKCWSRSQAIVNSTLTATMSAIRNASSVRHACAAGRGCTFAKDRLRLNKGRAC